MLDRGAEHGSPDEGTKMRNEDPQPHPGGCRGGWSQGSSHRLPVRDCDILSDLCLDAVKIKEVYEQGCKNQEPKGPPHSNGLRAAAPQPRKSTRSKDTALLFLTS